MSSENREELKKIITEYKSSLIQSEAEVRSKFIIPLIHWLGYPTELRAEEFPVYGYEGRKKIPAKNADFILFSEPQFAKYRKREHQQIKWVQEHSLLVIEAKKPTEPVEDIGQPTYYSNWTKAVAYLQTNGIQIKGYYRETLTSDIELIDCQIDDLNINCEILNFTYSNILKIKQKANAEALLKSNEAEKGTVITSDDELNLPENLLNYIRTSFGRNGVGISNIQLVSRFLNTIEFCLQNKIRYDIPEFMFSLPRKHADAYLYIDNMLFPYLQGKLTYFYWNEYERYHFENDIIIVEELIVDGKDRYYQIGFHVLDNSVKERIKNFERLRKCMNATSMRLQTSDTEKTSILLDELQGEKWFGREETLGLFEHWNDELNKMRKIEEFFGIDFNLKQIGPGKEVREQYEAVDLVYDGIICNNNAYITVPAKKIEYDDLEIPEPVIITENAKSKLPSRTIQGITFIPAKCYFKSGKMQIDYSADRKTAKIGFCCEYKIML